MCLTAPRTLHFQTVARIAILRREDAGWNEYTLTKVEKLARAAVENCVEDSPSTI